MTAEESEAMNGGGLAERILTGASGVMTTLGVCSLISGSSTAAIASMGVASLAACGPVGWAVLIVVKNKVVVCIFRQWRVYYSSLLENV